MQVAVVAGERFFESPVEAGGGFRAEGAGRDCVEDAADFRVLAVVFPGVVAAVAEGAFHFGR
ncbi:hypothetical protein DSECCO2_530340 [anaerobic digester metagenome]